MNSSGLNVYEDTMYSSDHAKRLTSYADRMKITSRELYTLEGRELRQAMLTRISNAFISDKIDKVTYDFYTELTLKATTKDEVKNIAADFMGITTMQLGDTGEFIAVLKGVEM